MGLYGTSQVVPWHPVVQWDGMDSIGTEKQGVGLYGTSQVVPGVSNTVEWNKE